jgi:hypothetical protein
MKSSLFLLCIFILIMYACIGVVCVIKWIASQIMSTIRNKITLRKFSRR